MKFKINKKNNAELITLDLDSTATVDELLLILYGYRSKRYEHLSFSEYQKFISVYQCFLYADRFKNQLLPGTNLVDYPLEDPCDLTWEEFSENQCLLVHTDSISDRLLFWQANVKSSDPEYNTELQKSSGAMIP